MPIVITQDEREKFALRCREWRSRYNVTQDRAARFLGVKRVQWARWERAEQLPIKHAQSIEDLLATDPHAGRPRQERFYQRKVRVQVDRQMCIQRLFDRSLSADLALVPADGR